MPDKTFIVTHPRAQGLVTVKGKTLVEALEKEGLDPNLWKEIPPEPESEATDLGDNQRDARAEDN